MYPRISWGIDNINGVHIRLIAPPNPNYPNEGLPGGKTHWNNFLNVFKMQRKHGKRVKMYVYIFN